MEELKNNSVVEEDTEGTVVVITDEEGNEYNYVEEWFSMQVAINMLF